MATPFGHTLAGAIICLGFRRAGWETPSIAIAAVAANLPDFDFVPGLLIGQPWRFHHGITHSIGAAALATLATALLWSLRRAAPRPPIARSLLFFFVCIFSHDLLDWATMDNGREIGIPILWPFDASLYIAPYQIFGDVWRHPLFSMKVWIHNAQNVLREAVILCPLLGLLLYWPRKEMHG